jgi:hypothetical protein
VAAAGPCGSQPRLGTLATDQVTLELGQCGEDVEHKLAARGGGVDRLPQAPEPNTTVSKRGDSVDQVTQRAAEPVELPHHQGIAGVELVQDAVQLGAGGQRAGGAAGLVGEHAVAAGVPGRVDLEVEVLLGGRDAGVAQRGATRELGSGWRDDGFPRSVAGSARCATSRSARTICLRLTPSTAPIVRLGR